MKQQGKVAEVKGLFRLVGERNRLRSELFSAFEEGAGIKDRTPIIISLSKVDGEIKERLGAAVKAGAAGSGKLAVHVQELCNECGVPA